MRFARLLISGAIAVMLGLIWTVAQTGMTDTNAHLCEFAAHFISGVGQKCQASDFIVSLCGAFAVLAALFFVIDLSGVVTRRRKPSKAPAVASPSGLDQHALDIVAAHTEELRLQREAGRIRNDPIQQAIRAALAPKNTVYHRNEDPRPRPPLVPDMSIRELFNYIDPTQLDDPRWASWVKVGGDVKDRLSTGQLSAWGRVSDPYGKTRPLTRIEADFWDFSEWTYEFFADGMELRVHARDRRNIQEAKSYLDIRFNRAEVAGISIWPVTNDISTKNERAKLISRARDFVVATVKANPDHDHFRRELESSEIFLRLRPYLTDQFKHALLSGRVVVAAPRASNMPGIAWSFIGEIDRLELEWELRI